MWVPHFNNSKRKPKQMNKFREQLQDRKTAITCDLEVMLVTHVI